MIPADAPMSWQTRLQREYAELQERIDNLQGFVLTPQFSTLDLPDREDLQEQLRHMRSYYAVLSRRTARYFGEL